jgi:DNA-directed RNA polymerase alpha subunit
MGVFDIEELPVSGSKLKSKRAVVSRPRDCTMCRECIRKEGWDRRVALKRVANHFIFTVESTGILPPEEIVKRVSSQPLPCLSSLSLPQAIQVLKSKTRGIKGLVSEYLHDAGVVS